MQSFLKYRVPLNFIGNGNADQAYGGKLDAWSFDEISGEDWFSQFRNDILQNIGKRYLPVYRMADGEYRFLMGRKYNFHRKPLWREIVAVTAEKIGLKNPHNWKTSWGERYAPQRIDSLRKALINNIKYIAHKGFLACYINDNGLHAFTEYNSYIPKYFSENKIKFDKENYIPFHFVCHLLMAEGSEEFFLNRDILVITGEGKDINRMKKTFQGLGVHSTHYISISDTSSMEDTLNLTEIDTPIDLCFVAAGIGSANIIAQLDSLNTVVLDIGGFISCFEDPAISLHGGIFNLTS